MMKSATRQGWSLQSRLTFGDPAHDNRFGRVRRHRAVETFSGSIKFYETIRFRGYLLGNLNDKSNHTI